MTAFIRDFYCEEFEELAVETETLYNHSEPGRYEMPKWHQNAVHP